MRKLQDLESAIIWSERDRCSSKMKPRLRAELVVLREQVRVPVAALHKRPCDGQVVHRHTHVSLFSKQYKLVAAKGR